MTWRRVRIDDELGPPAQISIWRFGRLNPVQTASTMRRHARPRHVGQQQPAWTREARPEGVSAAGANQSHPVGMQHYGLERWQSG